MTCTGTSKHVVPLHGSGKMCLSLLSLSVALHVLNALSVGSVVIASIITVSMDTFQ